MDKRVTIITMLKQLLQDTNVLHQQGAGYYSCVPIAQRFNKLLGESGSLFPDGDGILATFAPLDESDPNDPAEKMIVLQAIRVEIGQLTALLESLGDSEK
ncbi:MAG: hypothetical protein QGG73_10080 [Candidatus Hydrogenedentes bacterium]|jgi:hypothetical protein|nr:hypothetical protein [Candidatus Hydrogenedentota bacterium]